MIGVWNEARELSIFRAYLHGVPTSEMMREHGSKGATVSDAVRRRHVRLRQLGLNCVLQLAGCPIACIMSHRAPEYALLFRLSQEFLPEDQVEKLWFSQFSA